MVQDKSFGDQQGDGKDILDLKAEPTEAATERHNTENAEQSSAAINESAQTGSAPTEPRHEVATRSSSTPAMIGAGILGGLVALAAAGSMQYAGYLPSATAEKAATMPVADIDGLRAEIDGLKQQLATIPADLQPTGALEKRIALLEARPVTAGGSDPQEAQKIASLEDSLKTMQEAASQSEAEASKKISELSSRLKAAENTLTQRPGEAAVSRTIAATYLKAAIDRGDPFLTELETFAALAPDDPSIADLKPLAAAGVTSKAELVRTFDPVATSIIEAINRPTAGESWTDRLLVSAQSLVSIRPVGNVEGTDAGAVLARLEDKLKNGDLKGAALEWEALPEPGRAASSVFKQSLDNRIKADELTAALVERTKTSALQAG